jgi:Ca-activated chloride channel family protein
VTFAAPAALWLLPPVLVLAWYLVRFRRDAEPALGYARLDDLRDLEPAAARLWRAARPWLRSGALACFVLALARPQQGLRSDERDLLATDILLCLDVSDSMQAEDFAPKNRLETAKDAALRFIGRRKDDRLGLVLFGEFALTHCPLTTDHGALAGLVNEIARGILPGNRTALGEGLAAAVERLKASPARSRVIILLTDGANNAGSVDPQTAAKAAGAFGIRVYTVGCATREGGYVTFHDPVFGPRRQKIADTLDEDTLARIADATGGTYQRATDARALMKIFDDIDRLEKTEIKVKSYTEYLERFEWFLLPGLLLLALEMAVGGLLLRSTP